MTPGGWYPFLPLQVIFQDNSYSNNYSVVHSIAGGGSDMEAYPYITVCQGSGVISSTPINNIFTKPLVNYLPTDLVLPIGNLSYEACQCAVGKSRTIANYTAIPPFTSRYSTFPDYGGPILRVFGRGQHNIYITTYKNLTIPLPEPSMCYTAYSNQVWSITLFNGPGPLYGNEYNLNVKIVDLQWQPFSIDSPVHLIGETGTDIFSNYAPYLASFTTNTGLNISSCNTPSPPVGIKIKTQLGVVGKLLVFYRLCDGCSCSETSVVPVYITKLYNYYPVGNNFNLTVNASASVNINFTSYISEQNYPTNFLAISFDTSSSLLPPSELSQIPPTPSFQHNLTPSLPSPLSTTRPSSSMQDPMLNPYP
jgi:hypothetical protein